jgi:hypothetical protein
VERVPLLGKALSTVSELLQVYTTRYFYTAASS